MSANSACRSLPRIGDGAMNRLLRLLSHYCRSGCPPVRAGRGAAASVTGSDSVRSTEMIITPSPKMMMLSLRGIVTANRLCDDDDALCHWQWTRPVHADPAAGLQLARKEPQAVTLRAIGQNIFEIFPRCFCVCSTKKKGTKRQLSPQHFRKVSIWLLESKRKSTRRRKIVRIDLKKQAT